MQEQPLIVLLTDFSDASYRAFQPTLELAERIGGRLALLNVVEELVAIPHGAPLAPPVSMPTEAHDALLAKARENIKEAEAKLSTQLPLQVEVLAGTKVHEVVASFASDHNADFIAISSHGRSGFMRVLMGSTAESVLRHSKVPVIIYPQEA